MDPLLVLVQLLHVLAGVLVSRLRRGYRLELIGIVTVFALMPVMRFL